MTTVFAQFCAADGSLTGPPLAISKDATKEQLVLLLGEILSKSGPKDVDGDDDDNLTSLPYSLVVNGVEIMDSLNQNLPESAFQSEEMLRIEYIPQAVFRVRPISRCTSSLAGHSEAIVCVAFSPDGRRLASGSGDCSVRFWDLSTDTPLGVGQVHRKYVICLAWSPDARFLASGDADGVVQIWDGATGKAVGRVLRGHSSSITSMAWEPLHLADPSVGGPRLVTGSKDSTAKVWDPKRSALLATLGHHTDTVTSIRWSGDGTIYTASRDRTIALWNGMTLKTVLRGHHAHWINTLALSTDHTLRTGPFDHEGGVEGAADPRQTASLRYGKAVEMAPERLVSGSDDFTMFLWNTADLVVGSSGVESKAKPRARLTGHQGLVYQVAFSPDGRYIASASADKSVKLWNGHTGTFIASLRGHVGPVYQVSWSADSRLLLSASRDSTVKVWEVAGRRLKADLPGHADQVYAIDWSPTGDRAASGGKDRMLKLWRQ